MRITLLCVGWLFFSLVSGATAQEPPFLSHGTVFDDHVMVTVRGDPADHCVLYWSIRKGQTALNLPFSRGGRVALDVAPAWIFTSTLDGGIAFNDRGIWTFKLPSLRLLRGLVGTIYFQAVSFRVSGSALASRTSNLLEVDISAPTGPKSRFQEVLEIIRQDRSRIQRGGSGFYFHGGRPSLFGVRRVSTHLGAYQLDPFGNRILRPRVLFR